MSGDQLSDTKPDLPALPAGETVAAHPALAAEVGGRTHPGRVRANNEDTFHVIRFGRHLITTLSSLPPGRVPDEYWLTGCGIIVADGMGGHAAGEVASRAAVTGLLASALRTPDWILGREDEHLAAVEERTIRRFREVDEAVRDQARASGLWGMGTTLTLALSLSDALLVAHVGDSPAYLFRDGRLRRLTRDHTVGQQLADIDPEAADRLRHVLTRCIGGTAGRGSEPDVVRHRLAAGDRLLLCTDGLTDMVDDAAIAEELGRGTSSDEVCRALVDLALANGGKDNVTAVVATYRSDTRA
jgi:protein phosphatase